MGETVLVIVLAYCFCHLPHNKEDYDGPNEVIGLIIQQIVDDSVCPSFWIFEVRNLESGGVCEEIIQSSERSELNVLHLGF